jgi:lipopolysaccharide export system ATP-binding protein
VTTAERAVLEVDGVGVTFGSREVLKTASFSAWKGRITTLMGRNGAGKTTLLRVAVGAVRPRWGRVLFGGDFVERPSLPDLARRGLMYSAQESALTDLFSVEEHVRAFTQTYGGDELLPEIAGRLRLDALLQRRPRQLSGGEKQRVTLGLALLRGPRCLLMDEPFAGVAPTDRPLIAAGLKELRRQGVAIVVSGHDVADLFAVSDEVIWVVWGTTHWLGAPEQAREHHEFRRSYLGPGAGLGARRG